MTRFKLWVLGFFIKDLTSILRQFERLTTQLDAFAEKKLAEADRTQQVMADMARQREAAMEQASKALRVRYKVKETFS